MILRDADSPVCEDRAGFTTQRNRNIEKSCSIHHLEPMLRLVESLVTKAERAKTTTVEFFPLREATSHKCGWCETFVKGNRLAAARGVIAVTRAA